MDYTRKSWDVIVIGMGGMGSATTWQLASRGKRVLGLERFDIPHTMGSYHGVNRIIRLAYYEDPAYVPLLQRAYELWRDLEQRFGEQLLHITSSIDASAPDGEVFQGSLRSCVIHNLPHEVLNGTDLHRRFPGYELPADHLALLQPDGGFLLSERCIVAHTLLSIEAGAVIKAREGVLHWEPIEGGVRVTTGQGVYEAERLVISPGAWFASLLPEFATLAVPERQVLAWLQPRQPELFAPERFPVFNLTVPEGRFYGFPVYGVPGFKIGKYHHREQVVDPDVMNREPEPEDEPLLRDFTRRYFPAAAGETMALKSCIFTNTPDEHFIVDTLPGLPQVIIASPCSGHGFKFCSVIGEILADLAISGATTHDISLFALNRFER